MGHNYIRLRSVTDGGGGGGQKPHKFADVINEWSLMTIVLLIFEI